MLSRLSGIRLERNQDDQLTLKECYAQNHAHEAMRLELSL